LRRPGNRIKSLCPGVGNEYSQNAWGTCQIFWRARRRWRRLGRTAGGGEANRSPRAPYEIRPSTAPKSTLALPLILGSQGRPAAEEHVVDFLPLRRLPRLGPERHLAAVRAGGNSGKR
jgi:hypothetical protein